MNKCILFALILVFTLAIEAPSSSATIMTFSDRLSFYAAIDADPSLTKKIEGWDSFGDGTVIPSGTTINGISYYASLGDFKVRWRYAQTSRPSTLGAEWRPGHSFWPGDSMMFSFNEPVYAFGVSINTADRGNGTYKAINEFGDSTSSYYDPFPGYETGQFVGFMSDKMFRSLDLSALHYPPGPNMAWGLDDLTTASAEPIPEPSTIMLFVFGLAGITDFIRKKVKACVYNR